MTQIVLKIDELKPSASNVRAKHTKEDIAMMAASIKHRGIINPPSVAVNGDGKYEIIAGRLRYEGAKAAGAVDLVCDDISHLSESERVEISLSENVDRRGMTAMQYYVAFNKLFKAGMAVEKIGERFNKTEREVQQLLAIGSLPKKIIDLAENEEIGDRTLQALAIAGGKEVVRYGKLTAKERPRDWEIQEWLAGDKGMFMEKHALFDPKQYIGTKITDLFAKEDEVWLTDGAQFVMLQNEAINAKIAEFIKNKWTVEKVDHWQSWAYDKTSKANGGKVFYCRNEKSQAVEFHVGYKRQATAGKAPKTKDGKPAKKPDTSQAFDNFMAETRHAAVAFQMINDTRSGLVGTLILLLKQCDNVQFRNGGKKLSDAYSDSLHSGENFMILHDDYTAMLDELNLKDGHTWDISIEELGPKLLEYTPKTLTRWITLVVARNWDCEGKSGDEIGKIIGLTEVNVWEADDAFWNGIKNKATLLKIAAECDITASEKEPAKILRKRLKDKVPATWRPSWLKF